MACLKIPDYCDTNLRIFIMALAEKSRGVFVSRGNAMNKQGHMKMNILRLFLTLLFALTLNSTYAGPLNGCKGYTKLGVTHQ